MGIEKERKFPTKEAAKLTGVFLILYLSLFAFSTGPSGQVEAIRKRDKNKCQFPGCRNKTKYKVEVHHVIPQGYSFRINNMRPDSPFNAVCLCEEHHVGFPKKDYSTKVHREKAAMIFEPVHIDSYLVHLVLVGKFHLLPPRIKALIDEKFPGLYEYYEKVARDKSAVGQSYDDMYTTVMRKWRSEQLDKKQVYWDTENDPNLQIAAINATIKAIQRGWRFPLRMLGGNVSPGNRGTYAWDNLVALSIEKYVLSLSRRDINKLFNEMKKPGNESRIIYFEKIYVPAVAHLENRSDMGGIINNYFNSLPEKERVEKIKTFDRARKQKNAHDILFNSIYIPAINLFRLKQPQYKGSLNGKANGRGGRDSRNAPKRAPLYGTSVTGGLRSTV